MPLLARLVVPRFLLTMAREPSSRLFLLKVVFLAMSLSSLWSWENSSCRAVRSISFSFVSEAD
jgi:hypothetical protein